MCSKVYTSNRRCVQYCPLIHDGEWFLRKVPLHSISSGAILGEPRCAAMKRFQLFEFGDQSWLKGWFRDAYLDGLNLALRVARQYEDMFRPVKEWASKTNSPAVLDLGSGGGGPIETLMQAARRQAADMPSVVLSDLHPSQAHYERLIARLGGRVSFVPEPVSATNVHRTEFRARSLCSVFHHFPPEMARRILDDAIANCDGIFIMEPFDRDLRHFFMVLLSGPFLYMLAPFFSPRFELRKLLVSTLFPIIPLMLFFDGCVSVLRVYHGDEIKALLPAKGSADFEISSGSASYLGFFRSTYFCAWRVKSRTPANG